MHNTLSRDLTLAIVGPGREDKGQGGKYLLLPPDYKGETHHREQRGAVRC
jgi:hypothetical protein